MKPFCEEMMGNSLLSKKEWSFFPSIIYILDEIFNSFGTYAYIEAEKTLVEIQAQFLFEKHCREYKADSEYYTDTDAEVIVENIQQKIEINKSKNVNETEKYALNFQDILDLKVCRNFYHLALEMEDKKIAKLQQKNNKVKIISSCNSFFSENFPSSWNDMQNGWALKISGKNAENFLGANVSAYKSAILAMRTFLSKNPKLKNILEHGEISFKSEKDMDPGDFENIMRILLNAYGMRDHLCLYRVFKGKEYFKIKYCLLRFHHLENIRPSGQILHADGRTNYPACRKLFTNKCQEFIEQL